LGCGGNGLIALRKELVACSCLQFVLLVLPITLVVIVVGIIFLPMLKSPILTFFFDYCLNVFPASIGWYCYFACQSFLGTPYTYMVVKMVGVYAILFGKFFENLTPIQWENTIFRGVLDTTLCDKACQRQVDCFFWVLRFPPVPTFYRGYLHFLFPSDTKFGVIMFNATYNYI
jgi:hypothetical protein